MSGGLFRLLAHSVRHSKLRQLLPNSKKTKDIGKMGRDHTGVVDLVLSSLDDILTHSGLLGLAESLNLQTNLVGELVDLTLVSLPRFEHLENSSRGDMDIELGADHVVVCSDVEVMHSFVELALDGPSSLGVGADNASVILKTLEISGEESVVLDSVVGSVSLAGFIAGRSILANDETINRSHVALELDTTILGHRVGSIVKDAAEGKEKTGSRASLFEINVSLFKGTPETDTLHTREGYLSLGNVFNKRGVRQIESNIDALLALSDEFVDVGLKLLGVGSAEVNDVSTGLELLNDLLGGGFDDGHFIRSLVGLVGNLVPFVHAGSVGDFLGEVTLAKEGLGKLIVNKGEVDGRTTNVDNLTISGVGSG